MWNIALDQNSSPKLAGVDGSNSNRGLVTIRSDVNDTWSYEMGYYSLGHFSKFLTFFYFNCANFIYSEICR
jgi:glucosylceramidase